MSTEIVLLFVAGAIVVLVVGALDSKKRRRTGRWHAGQGGAPPLGHGHWHDHGSGSDGSGSGGSDGGGSGGDGGGGGGA